MLPLHDPAPVRDVVLGRVEAQQHERAADHDDRALLLGVGDADDPERHPRQVLPVGPGEPLEVDRLPQREQLVVGHVDVRRLDRADLAVGVHDRVLLGVGQDRVRDPALALAVEQLHASASLTASSKPSGWSLRPGRRLAIDDHLRPETVHERLDQPVGDRGHEGDPVGRQARREHGNADDDGWATAHERCGAAHHLTIGEDLGAAELELLQRVFALARVRQRPHHVRERDRLRLGVQPARDDHHRQALDEVLEDVVGGAAGADDHRRAHVHEPVAEPRPQQLGDLVAAAQVLGVLGAEPAEVDHPLDAGVGRRLGEVDRRLAVLGGEVAAAAHRVHEVVGRLDAFQGLGHALARTGRRPSARRRRRSRGGSGSAPCGLGTAIRRPAWSRRSRSRR